MVDQRHVDALIDRLEQETPTSGLVAGNKFLYPKPQGWHQMALEGVALVEALLSISKVRPQTADYIATVNDFFIPVDATAGNVTITIPKAVDEPGRQYAIMKMDASANYVRIQNATDTINGAAYKDLVSQYRSVWIDNDGTTKWFTPSEYLGPTAFLRGNLTIVDGTYGNDATGAREDTTRPFQTIQAALAASISGDAVLVMPGIYTPPVGGLVIPTGISLRGVSEAVCRIKLLNVTADTTLVTMGENSYIQDFELELTSAGHYTLTGIKFGGTTNLTAEVDHVDLEIDNSGAGPGASNVTGILVQCTGMPAREVNAIHASSVTVNSTGSGVKRALLQNVSASNFFVRDCNWVVHGGIDAIAIETNFAGCLLGAVTGVADGDLADVSRTLGNMELGQIDLIHSNANGYGFTATQISFSIVWADPGGSPSNATRFYRPGSAAVTATEIKLNVPRKCVIKKLHARSQTPPGVGKTDTWTVRKNGVDTTLTVSLTGLNTLASIDAVSASFAANDDVSLKLQTAVSTGCSDTVCVVETY
jgi:hypothetical protein